MKRTITSCESLTGNQFSELTLDLSHRELTDADMEYIHTTCLTRIGLDGVFILKYLACDSVITRKLINKI